MSSSKLAVVGGGKWGINHIKNLHRMNALACVIEASPERREQLKAEFSTIEVLPNLDLLDPKKVAGVVVATPVNTHYPIAKELLNKGFPLLIEKPTTTKLSETEELLKIAKEKNLCLMTGFLLLYQPAISKIKELIAANSIGDLKSFQFTRANYGRARSFENAFWSLGVHDVAVFAYLCNQEIKTLHSIQHSQREETGTTEDDVRVSIQTKNNIWAHFHSTWNYPFMRRELLISGSQGFLHFDEVKNTLTLHKKGFSQKLENIDSGIETFQFDKVEALEIELKDFISSIENKYEAKAGSATTRKVSEILEKIFYV